MSIATAWHLWWPISDHAPLSDAMAETASRADWGWIATGDIRSPVGNADGALDYGGFVALGARLRAINPKHRTGWYVGGTASQVVTDPLWSRLADRHLLHAPNGQPLCGPIPHQGGGTAKLINLMDPSVQQDVVGFYLDTLRANGWHGLLLDSFTPVGYQQWVASAANFNLPGGCLEGPAHTRGWWEQALGSFGERLRWTLEQAGYEVLGVGLAPDMLDPARAWEGAGCANLADYLSGLMFEHPHRAMGDPGYMQRAITAARSVTQKRRKLFWSVSPSLKGDPPAAALLPTYRRFHTALYLLVQEVPYTSLGYWPFEAYRGWSGPDETLTAWWDSDWDDLDRLGAPVGPVATQTNAWGTAWGRRYARGLVLVNPTNVNLSWRPSTPISYRLWDRVGGATVAPTAGADGQSLTIPPYQGLVLWDA